MSAFSRSTTTTLRTPSENPRTKIRPLGSILNENVQIHFKELPHHITSVSSQIKHLPADKNRFHIINSFV